MTILIKKILAGRTRENEIAIKFEPVDFKWRELCCKLLELDRKFTDLDWILLREDGGQINVKLSPGENALEFTCRDHSETPDLFIAKMNPAQTSLIHTGGLVKLATAIDLTDGPRFQSASEFVSYVNGMLGSPSGAELASVIGSKLKHAPGRRILKIDRK